MRAIAFSFALLAFTSVAWADTITLHSGDRISGTIVKKSADNIELQTDFAGTLQIDWSKIARVSSRDAITVVLEDGSVIKGITTESDQGKLQIVSPSLGTTTAVPLTAVKWINPSDTDLGKGVNVKGHLSVGASAARGNTDSTNLHLQGEIVARSSENRYTAGVQANYAEDSGQRSEENYQVYFKYDHFFSDRLYGYSNVSAERDEFQDLDLRTSLGVGGGYQIWENDLGQLATELGISYVYEARIIGQDSDYPALRWAMNYDRWLLDKHAQVFYRHEFLQGLSDTADQVAQLRTGIRIPVHKRWQAGFEVQIDWDNSPSPGTKSTDQNYIFSLGYSL